MESETSPAEPAIRTVRTPGIAVVIMAEGDDFRPASQAMDELDGDTRLIVVGSGAGVKQKSEQAGLSHHQTFSEAIRSIPADIDYVWVLSGNARPQSGALRAMLAVSIRHQAALVGSKILDSENQERLVSVGNSTDVFGVSSSGLDESELDFAQYDVIREVSSLSTVSLLARRQLWAVLGGLDQSLPPVAQGLDFCQRVRLAGGRVVVAPSSRVLYPAARFPHPQDWRERAGRMRAMFKVYRLLTLIWAIPLDVLINLLEGVFNLVRGRTGRLAGFLAALVHSVFWFPSTIAARLGVQKNRMLGDEDLFRYQISGSVILRDMGNELAGRLGEGSADEQSWTASVSSRLRRSAPFGFLAALLYTAAASRSLWVGGLPTGGFSFPPGDDPAGVLAAYAGGWNDVGLGTVQPPHPAAVVTSAVHWLLLGWSGSQLLLTAVALWAGLIGASRLFRSAGVGASASYLGAVVYLVGTASVSVMAEGYWPMLIALGALPWAIVAAVRPWPESHRNRIGDLAMAALASAVLAAVAPVAVVVPVAVVILGWLAGVGWSGWSVVRVTGGAVVGLSSISAYLWANGLDVWSQGPSLEIHSQWVFWAVVGGAGLLTLMFGGRVLRGAAGLGLALSGAGLVVAHVESWEVAVGGAALAAVGTGMLSAAAVSAGGARSGGGRLGGAVALLSGVGVLVLGMGVLDGGRAGLPEDQWKGRLDFATSLSDSSAGSRLLLIGAPGSLPGMERDAGGLSYRLLRAGPPTLEQAWLPAPEVGDRALAEAVAGVSASGMLRPGELLAPFGIRWVVVDQGTGFSEHLTSQLDLRAVAVTQDTVVYENLVALPRAYGPYVGAWESAGANRVEGPVFPGRISIGDNAHPRWGPNWAQQSWWNTISGADGVGRFDPEPLGRMLGWWGAVLIIGLAGLAWWGRGAFR